MSADAAERGFNSPRTNRLTGMTVARGVLIVDVADEAVEISPTDWVQAQASKILETGTTEGIDVLGSPIVLLTLRGARPASCATQHPDYVLAPYVSSGT
jgi:hypothetical protein